MGWLFAFGGIKGNIGKIRNPYDNIGYQETGGHNQSASYD